MSHCCQQLYVKSLQTLFRSHFEWVVSLETMIMCWALLASRSTKEPITIFLCPASVSRWSSLQDCGDNKFIIWWLFRTVSVLTFHANYISLLSLRQILHGKKETNTKLCTFLTISRVRWMDLTIERTPRRVTGHAREQIGQNQLPGSTG